jgi:transposase
MIRFGRDSSDGGDHGWNGHCGEEVCGAAERGGTRATASADPQGKKSGEAALESAHFVEVRCFGRRRGWSDSKIIAALDTSASMAYRVRKQLVEEGFAAVLSRKPRAHPPVPAIFDGEKQAKLIALACSKPPKGRVRWTLRLLENKVVELGIVERASDSTIGRALKKTVSSRIAGSAGSSRRRLTAAS